MDDAASEQRPAWSVTLQDFPGVTVVLDRPPWPDEKTGQEMIRFCYYGWPEALIAAGVITPELLAPTRKHRRDGKGLPVSVTSYWHLRDGQPQKFVKVRRTAIARIPYGLPGAQAAAETAERYMEWMETKLPEPERTFAMSERRRQKKMPHLRLVVDNTRRPEVSHG